MRLSCTQKIFWASCVSFQVDLRTNPAIFIGGGSVLFRPLIEHTPLVAKATFIEDPKANAIGYEMLARGQMAMRAVQ
ncbi:MAG: hypothetical protein ACLTV1_03070 [Christensenellales bacterium]